MTVVTIEATMKVSSHSSPWNINIMIKIKKNNVPICVLFSGEYFKYKVLKFSDKCIVELQITIRKPTIIADATVTGI